MWKIDLVSQLFLQQKEFSKKNSKKKFELKIAVDRYIFP